MYNGYYKGHGYKFQAVVTPNGLIEDLYGPEGGRHHDIFLWQMSRVGREMDALPDAPNGGRYVIYGDAAYRKPRARNHIAVAYPRYLPLTPQEEHLNKVFNKARVYPLDNRYQTTLVQLGRFPSRTQGCTHACRLPAPHTPAAGAVCPLVGLVLELCCTAAAPTKFFSLSSPFSI